MTASTLYKIRQSRLGGAVERCHGVPHHGSYSNAKHQWGVAMLMWYLFPEDFQRLVLHCLTHDVPEGWVGDIPAPTLRHVAGIRERLSHLEGEINRSLGLPAEDSLSPEDYAKLKACDRLELYIWCLEQQDMGNRYVSEFIEELDHYFSVNPLPAPADELYRELQTDHGIARQAGVMRSLTKDQAA